MFNEILYMNNVGIETDQKVLKEKNNKLMENRIKRISGSETSPIKRKSYDNTFSPSKQQKLNNEESDNYHLSDEQKVYIYV